MEKIKRAKTWLVKHWWVFVGVLLVVVGFFLGKRGSDLKQWRRVERKIGDIENTEKVRRTEVRQIHEKKIEEIEVEHVETIRNLDEKQKERYENLRTSPRRLNNYLNSFLPK